MIWKLVTGMLVAGGVFAALPATAQDDPFANPGEENTAEEDPFAIPGDETEGEDSPFEGEGQESSGESGPFADPGQERDTAEDEDSPFADPGEEPSQQAPFEGEAAAPEDPFAENSPFDVDAGVKVGTTAAERDFEAAARVQGVYTYATQPGFQSFNQLQEMAERFDSAGFNRLYAEVRTIFGTAYDSDLEKPFSYIRAGYTNPLAEARELLPDETEIYAVVWLLPSYSAAAGRTPPKSSLFGRNPGLMNRDIEGDVVAAGNAISMDPGNPEARAYLENLVLEIDRIVKPDGYLFRGLEYPGARWGYSDRAVQAFRTLVGGTGNPPPDDPTWTAWRRAQLGELLLRLRRALVEERGEEIPIGVYIKTDGMPPTTWEQYQQSPQYAERMQDYIRWVSEGTADEITFEVHERLRAQENTLEPWVNFANNNAYSAIPIISLGGHENFTNALVNQYATVRSRGVGTMLHHYAKPVRSNPRGFYETLPNLVFGNAPGRPIPGVPLSGRAESRRFARMAEPPPRVAAATATPREGSGLEQPLVFSTPTPQPTPTKEPQMVPESINRQITLASGEEVEAVVLEVTPSTITFRQEGSSAIVIPRSLVVNIQPPL